MANATPNIPVVNAGALYVNGLHLSNSTTTPDTVVNVSSGAARNSNNVNDIIVSSAVTLSISFAGAGGLDFGTVAASTLYAVYAIGSSTNQIGNGTPTSAYPGTVLASTNFTTPILPVGYDMFRRIGAIRIDSASHVEKFIQTGDGSTRHVWYDVALPTAVTAGTSAFYEAVSLAGFVPPARADVNLLALLTPTAANDTVNLSYSGVGAIGQAVVSGSVAGVLVTSIITCPQAATNSIYYKVDGSVALSVAGYAEHL